MRTLCYSVRLESLTEISDKCYIATSFDGSEDYIPKSHVFGEDYEVQKSTAYWISAWILERKNIQYSTKKHKYFDSVSRKELPNVIYEKHVPKKIELTEIKPDVELLK